MEIIATAALQPPADATVRAPRPDLPQAEALRSALASLTPQTPPGVTAPTNTDLLRTLLAAIQSDAGTRGLVEALVADLGRAKDQPAVPQPVREQILRTLALAEPLRAFIAQDPSRPPATTPPATTPMAALPQLPQPALIANLATSLSALQVRLQEWSPAAVVPPAPAHVPVSPANPAAIPAGASPAPALAPTAAHEPDPAQAALAASLAVAAFPGPAAVAVPPGVPRGGVADALAALLMSQQAVAAPGETLQRLRPARASNPAEAEPDPSPAATNAAVSAYRKAQPTAPVQPAGQWPADASAAFIARTLAQRAEAALTQVKLLEVTAQLRQQDPASAASTPEGRWTFDIPLNLPLGQAQVRFDIEREAFKSRHGKQATVWRARFSIDVEPLGPVHVQIALLGEKAWVSLWAERLETMALLDTRQAELREELDADSLEAEIICCLGTPPAHLPGSGAVWDGAA